MKKFLFFAVVLGTLAYNAAAPAIVAVESRAANLDARIAAATE